jgi:hypothetical protein
MDCAVRAGVTGTNLDFCPVPVTPARTAQSLEIYLWVAIPFIWDNFNFSYPGHSYRFSL